MSHADPYYYDAHGDRPQKTGYRTKAEAREALQEALRQMRLGALHRPRVPLRQLTEAFLDQHQAAPSTLVGLRQNMRPARHVLQAAMRWKWIEDNPATLVKNPTPKPGEIHPFESWDELDAIADELDDVCGPLVIFLAGTGVRPEEGFGGEWRDVDLVRRVFMVRRAFAKGRLK